MIHFLENYAEKLMLKQTKVLYQADVKLVFQVNKESINRTLLPGRNEWYLIILDLGDVSVKMIFL